MISCTVNDLDLEDKLHCMSVETVDTEVLVIDFSPPYFVIQGLHIVNHLWKHKKSIGPSRSRLCVDSGVITLKPQNPSV